MVVEKSVGRPRTRTGRPASALAAAVIGVVAAGSDDPIVPPQGFETDKESLLAALAG